MRGWLLDLWPQEVTASMDKFLKLRKERKMNDEAQLALLDAEVEDVEVSQSFGSPAGDTALLFLQKAFTKIETYLGIALPDTFYKPILLTQLKWIFRVLESAVEQALTAPADK